jgi:hypothetical protein
MAKRMKWVELARGAVTCVDWSRWIEGQRQVDPYLIWADMTGGTGFGWDPQRGEEHGNTWPVLMEIDREAWDKELGAVEMPGRWDPSNPPPPNPTVWPIWGCIDVPGAYLKWGPEGSPNMLASRFLTARVHPSMLDQLLKESRIRRFQLGLPRIPRTDVEKLRMEGVTSAKHGRIVFGIIDDGCAFANPNFCDDTGRTRVRFLWDQDFERKRSIELQPTRWSAAAGFGYGAELRPASLDGAVAAGDELAAYRSIDYVPVRNEPYVHGTTLHPPGGASLPDQALLRSTHGTGALDIGAGTRLEDGRPGRYETPLADQRALHRDAREAPLLCKDFAAYWPVIFVQLPTRSVLDTSGGSLGVHVLDGLRYILSRASSLSEELGEVPTGGGSAGEPFPTSPAPQPETTLNRVVINVSYGAIAGPHDGTSIVERAIADLVENNRTTWVVVAAGNAHRSKSHARLRLSCGEEKSLHWVVGPDNPHESFLEIWFPKAASTHMGADAALLRRLTVKIWPPGDVEPQLLRLGQMWLLQSDASPRDRIMAGAIFARRVAQGDIGTMALIAVRSTRMSLFGTSEESTPSLHGTWVVSVGFRPEAEGEADPRQKIFVHAWTERNDLLYGNARPNQTHVLSDDPVPEPTEFMPETKQYMAEPCGWLSPDIRDPLQPSSSFGTLANLSPMDAGMGVNDREFWAWKDKPKSRGAVVVVGGYRIADGEIASYSSGGPARDIDPDQLRQCSTGLPHVDLLLRHRFRPDADAPSDVGAGLRGLRVTGTRGGSFARLSGTSAAAPSVARYIANFQFRDVWSDWLEVTADQATLPDPFDLPAPGASAHSARMTPTPVKDDLFRRGRRRIR